MERRSPPLRFLIVEDDALLALDLEMVIEDAGHIVVAEAASLDGVVALSGSIVPDVAFIDIQLAKGSSGLDVCAQVRQQWTAAIIVFVTANVRLVPSDFAGAHGVIPKPFSRNGLRSALRYLEEGVCRPPPTSALPQSFIASPAFAATWAP
jgi:CheY-like chemotaxis protein